MAVAGGLGEGLRPSQEEAEWASAAAPVPASASNAVAQPPSVPDDVREFLEGAGLAAFIGSFAANGYDELPIIRLMEAADMDEVGLKGGHKLKLREALRRANEAEGCGTSCSASAPARAAPAGAAAPPRPQRSAVPTPEPRHEPGPTLGTWPDEEGSWTPEELEEEGGRAPDMLEVWHVRVQATGVEKLQRVILERTEAHCLCPPERDWAWIKATFPVKEEELAGAVAAAEAGLVFQGRRFFLASSSKGDYRRGASAWMASPPYGDASVVEAALGYRSNFRLQADRPERPYPLFLLRGRVKQLFSSTFPVDAAIDLRVLADRLDENGLLRDDGAGCADPAILEAAALQRYGPSALEPKEGLCRRVVRSAQVRKYGIKGMLDGQQRLRGSGVVEAAGSMKKFASEGMDDLPLRIVSFSVVRPKALARAVVLRLQARGVPEELLLQAQEKFLGRLTGPMTCRRAHRLLKAQPSDASGEDEESVANYMRSFALMLSAGFNVNEQPLLTILQRQQLRNVKAAQQCLHLDGVWSGRGHPEPRDLPGGPCLRGRQIFFLVPEPGGEWRALTGNVVVGREQDLDPHELRCAEAVDDARLRAACTPGVLYFAVQGERLQVPSWDMDGDNFFAIEGPVADAVAASGVEQPPLPTPPQQAAAAPAAARELPPLAVVQARFLRDMRSADKIGLLHFQWELAAGAGPTAAVSPAARRLAADYAASLDVEKGGRRVAVPARGRAQKWDFMEPDGPKSPTAMGAIYRMAKLAAERLEVPVQPVARADVDLQRAWSAAEERLGASAAAELQQVAQRLHRALMEMIQAAMDREAEERISAGAMWGKAAGQSLRRKERWTQRKRAEVAAEAGRLGATLEDVALAAWHWKYQVKNVAMVAQDPDQFPWTILGPELRAAKCREAPCCQAEHERLRSALQRLHRAAEAARERWEEAAVADELLESISRHRAVELPCRRCAAAAEAEHGELRLQCERCAAEGLSQERAQALAECLHRLRRPSKERLPVSTLRYCKAEVETTFRHAPAGQSAGQPVAELAERLAEEQRSGAGGLLAGLRLVCVRFHGEVFVVEGNRRLWAVKRASEMLGGVELEVNVEIHDLFLGRMHAYASAAVRMFWDKYTTPNGGRSVTVRDSAAETPAAASSAPAGPCSCSSPSAPSPPRASAPGGSRTPGRPGATMDGSRILGFGKYKGLTYWEVLLRHPDFARWAVAEVGRNGGSEDLQLFAQYVQGELAGRGLAAAAAAAPPAAPLQPERPAPAPAAPAAPPAPDPAVAPAAPRPPAVGSELLGFGKKHCGKTFREVLLDRGYCAWACREASKESASQELLRFVDYVRSERPGL